MSPIMEEVYDYETQSSDWPAGHDSPVIRHYSEPIYNHTNSIEASLSPAPSVRQTKCPWCGKYFEACDADLALQYDALKEHMASVHPRIARLSVYDGASDDVEEDAIEEELNGTQTPTETDAPAIATTTATDVEDDVEGGLAIGDDVVDTPVDNEADRALKNQLHEVSRQQAHASVEKRLESFWNIHRACNFTANYDDEIADLQQIWDRTYPELKHSKKNGPADIPNRPNPYQEATVKKGGFLKVTPVEEYVEQLRNPEAKSYDELYAITRNAAHALKTYQDEWLAIEELTKLATRHVMKKSANPRKTERPEVFEDKKEATLYGYKHDPKEAMVGIQDPFIQGGFRPTPAQLRKMRAAVGADNSNPDGWKGRVRFGVNHVPRYQNPPLQSFEAKQTRKRKAAQKEAAELLGTISEINNTTPPALEPDNEGRPAKRLTRARAGKTPQPHTAPPSPGHRGTRRVPGGRIKTPQPAKNPPARSSARVATARAAAAPITTVDKDTTITTTTTAAAAAWAIAPSSEQAPPPAAPAPFVPPTPIAPAPPVIAPAASAPLSAPVPPPTASAPPLAASGQTLDAATLARRQKIANSKNPRRTEAMLNHWDRFNKEGRVRNPKRTKAQIEADKVTEAARKATESPKEPGPRKRKAPGPAAKGPATKQVKVENSTTTGPVTLQPAPIQPALGPGSLVPPPPPQQQLPGPTPALAHATGYPPAPPTLVPINQLGVPAYSPYQHNLAPQYPHPAPSLLHGQQQQPQQFPPHQPPPMGYTYSYFHGAPPRPQ